MNLSKDERWSRFQKYYTEFPSIGLAIDLSRMNFADDFHKRMAGPIQKAFGAMADLENGGMANPDEHRMVGHYWLRNPELAPTPEIRKEIEDAIASIKSFATDVHAGALQGGAGPFRNLLVIGIGGSALGPQFVSHALSNPKADKMKVYFLDNTDPDGMDLVISRIGDMIGETLTVVISKSGGTKETRNGMLEVKAAYERKGLNFGRHAVAITGAGSELHAHSTKEGWLRQFPMWDWVGGRTSELSPVGLLPAALQGIDITELIQGARHCDEVTRQPIVERNPAAQLSLMWFHAGNGKGQKELVVLPYKDRLELFSRYLQQLIMESLGKERDLAGNVVKQGLTVFGNKGSTDQHAYVQQLREGLDNFFAHFIEVLKDRQGASMFVDPEISAGDYLHGFLMGTRSALHENGRESITVTIESVSPFSIGVLIALFERSVGLYASLINVNAYHQPGVEAGKKAAQAVIESQTRILSFLRSHPLVPFTSAQIANEIGSSQDPETVFKICQHLSCNERHIRRTGRSPAEATFSFSAS